MALRSRSALGMLLPLMIIIMQICSLPLNTYGKSFRGVFFGYIQPMVFLRCSLFFRLHSLFRSQYVGFYVLNLPIPV